MLANYTSLPSKNFFKIILVQTAQVDTVSTSLFTVFPVKMITNAVANVE